MYYNDALKKTDEQIAKLIEQETDRQHSKLHLIPSENVASRSVHEAVGSVFMHKYAEGEVGARYYEGNQYADQIEQLAKDRIREAFNLPEDWDAIVQAHSGSPANLAVYAGLLEPGDKIVSMYLPDGGHLSHGWSFEPAKDKRTPDSLIYKGGSRKISFVSKIFDIVQYKTDKETELFDYDALAQLIKDEKPKMVITGGTAYPREIDYQKVAEAARSVGAYYLADVAHEAGLIAGQANKSPVGIADIVTFTTHKTFRGPRGAVILAKADLASQIARGVFPTLQGGPHLHSIAGIAVAAKEAATDSFKDYSQKIVDNAQTLAKELQDLGYYIVSGGTDKHLLLVNIRRSQTQTVAPKFLTRALDYAGIVLNYNTVPWESGTPANPSGMRLGTPIVTSRGMGATEMKFIAQKIDEVNKHLAKYEGLKFKEFNAQLPEDQKLKDIAAEVKALCDRFPIPEQF